VERCLQSLRGDLQDSFKAYTPLELHSNAQDKITASCKQLEILIVAGREARLHSERRTLALGKQIEESAKTETSDRERQFEKFISQFEAFRATQDSKVQSLRGDLRVCLQSYTTLEIHSNALDKITASLKELETHLTGAERRLEELMESESASRHEEAENLAIRLSKESQGNMNRESSECRAKFVALSQLLRTEIIECNSRLDEHHAWSAELASGVERISSVVQKLETSVEKLHKTCGS